MDEKVPFYLIENFCGKYKENIAEELNKLMGKDRETYECSFLEMTHMDENEWVARIMEAYCHNNNRIASTEEIDVWRDVWEYINNLNYELGNSAIDPEVLCVIDREILVLYFSDENGSGLLLNFVYSGEYLTDDLHENIVRWDKLSNRFLDFFQGNEQKQEAWIVVFDKLFDDSRFNNYWRLDDPNENEWTRWRSREGFKEKLNKLLVDKFNGDAPKMYKKAWLSAATFSAIINGRANPKKENVFALAIACKMNFEETEQFLASAGYAFDFSKKTDCIVRNAIERENYRIGKINEQLYANHQRVLGTVPWE